MSEHSNINRGTIAKNARKSKETDADITGSINIDGKEFWLNGWQKTNSRDNSTFYSLAVKPKQPRQEAAPVRRNSGPPADFSDLNGEPDDLPF
jgi:hypothetical protein